MATFYVGQRVRIVRTTHSINNFLIGRETVVSGFNGRGDVLTPLNGEALYGSGFNPSHLEPIQYDGNKVIEWSECLWQPEHIRTAA